MTFIPKNIYIKYQFSSVTRAIFREADLLKFWGEQKENFFSYYIPFDSSWRTDSEHEYENQKLYSRIDKKKSHPNLSWKPIFGYPQITSFSKLYKKD